VSRPRGPDQRPLRRRATAESDSERPTPFRAQEARADDALLPPPRAHCRRSSSPVGPCRADPTTRYVSRGPARAKSWRARGRRLQVPERAWLLDASLSRDTAVDGEGEDARSLGGRGRHALGGADHRYGRVAPALQVDQRAVRGDEGGRRKLRGRLRARSGRVRCSDLRRGARRRSPPAKSDRCRSSGPSRRC
jgi:hypothetical protein